MSDRPPEAGVLSFPSGDDDPVVAAAIASLYASTPSRGAAEAERVASAVLADARSYGSKSRVSRWWWGAAAAALLVAVTMRPWRPGAISRDADTALVRAQAEVAAPRGAVFAPAGGGEVRFDITLPAGASDVALVGDFNGWDENATPMAKRGKDGTWSAEVPLAPGRHIYAFIVDGVRWLIDPLAPQVPDAGFGPANAVVVASSR